MDLASFLLAKAPIDILEPLAYASSQVVQNIFDIGFKATQTTLHGS